MITRKELIQNYIIFFKEKEHVEIKNASLVPENDASVLFTTAGMHPLVPYLLGEPHPQGKRLTNVQRCIRTGDIDEVGDTYHHTMFEMLGNWSIGDYFKEEAIKMTFEFHTKVLGISKERYAVTCFGGDKRFSKIPKDEEAAKIWESVGVPKERIAFLEGGVLESDNNWWGPPGKTGPCGPCTEQFYWKLNDVPAPKVFDPNDKNWVEIGNDVLMQYVKDESGNYVEAKQKNIDFGGGVERTVAVLNGLEDNYLAGMWLPLIEAIEEKTNKSYETNKQVMRIIVDHIKASCFMLADGIVPTNMDQGYILRRLIRRAFRNARILGGNEKETLLAVAQQVIVVYDDYSLLQENKTAIAEELEAELDKFEKTLDKGLKEFEKMATNNNISGKDAFLLFQSYGFPLEMTQELAKEKEISVNSEEFYDEMKKHQELSRTASAGKFKSGLADNSNQTKKLHTATHLLNESLRVVLDKPDLHQKGSNITPERLRFDFNFDRKLTPEEIKKVEELVNLKIQSNLPVRCETMPLAKAKEIGAQGVFEDKYGDEVKVYHIGSIGEEFSQELCAGPHVDNTSEIGHFKIIKEESSSAGVRRIKAVVE